MIVTWILERLRAYARYRDTVRELSRLSDRELADVGLSRADIEAAARLAARG
ncbi:DUF1127 domain-containing protein [Salinarimonas sp.]|uniref:DUF1127 domain-containing protein n=1 Tax=Salinarimonas sp. TaxID=2766526 RepID=UPI00391B4501